MMSLVSKLQIMAAALVPLTDHVYHYWRPRPNGVDRYIIWAEDTEDNSFHAGNVKLEQAIHGTIDLYTKEEFDSLIDAIQDKLNSLENVSWSLDSSQYEDDTGLIHYEWEWRMR